MFTRRLILFGILTALISPTKAVAQATPPDSAKIGFVTAQVVALDGDTRLIRQTLRDDPTLRTPIPIEHGKTRIRLWGIDAPEMSDRDGWFARGVLDAALIAGGGVVNCDIVNTHKKRLVGVCYVAEGLGSDTSSKRLDVASMMLATGFAVTYRTFTYGREDMLDMADYYDHIERAAQNKGRGFWSRAPGE